MKHGRQMNLLNGVESHDTRCDETNGERWPVSQTEYFAMMQIMGALHLLEKEAENLHRRLRKIRNGWRDYRLVVSTLDKIARKITSTVPVKKLRVIEQELRHMRCVVKCTRDVTGKVSEEWCYVPAEKLLSIIGRLANYECLLCDKSGAAAKKCTLKRDLEECYPWDFELKDNMCPLAGSMTEIKEEV